MSVSPPGSRDSDEMSIASDFSIIPEATASLDSGGEVVPLHESYLTVSTHTSHPVADTGKVTFQNIQANYVLDTDIAVTYTLAASVSPKPSDRVAVYKVGFTSPQDYLWYEWAPSPSERSIADDDLPLTVVFKKSRLPKDAGEFFQFCYVTHEGRIIGASTPFQLCEGDGGLPLALPRVHEDDTAEEGMVLVQTETSELHDTIMRMQASAKEQREKWAQASEQLSVSRTLLEEKLQLIKQKNSQIQDLEASLKRELIEKNELITHMGEVVEERGHLEDRYKSLQKKLAALNQELAEANKQLSNERDENKRLNEVIAGIAANTKRVEQQLESLNQESQRDKDQIEAHLAKEKMLETNIRAVKSERDEARAERDEALRELEFWTSASANDKSEINSLSLKFTAVNEELINKIGEVDQYRREMEELQSKIAKLEREMATEQETKAVLAKQVKTQAEEQQVSLERQYVVVQDNQSLQQTIQQLKENQAVVRAQLDNAVEGKEAAEKVAIDLSKRLQAARSEYQKLANVNSKLLKKVKKLRLMLAKVGSEMTESNSSDAWMTVSCSELQASDCDEMQPVQSVAAPDVSVMVAEATSAEASSEIEADGPGSECSCSTHRLSEVVTRKMDEIVDKFSLQLNQLKLEIKEKERERRPSVHECVQQLYSSMTDQMRQESESLKSAIESGVIDLTPKNQPTKASQVDIPSSGISDTQKSPNQSCTDVPMGLNFKESNTASCTCSIHLGSLSQDTDDSETANERVSSEGPAGATFASSEAAVHPTRMQSRQATNTRASMEHTAPAKLDLGEGTSMGTIGQMHCNSAVPRQQMYPPLPSDLPPQQVLYGGAFLPMRQTAPVFLPEGSNQRPPAIFPPVPLQPTVVGGPVCPAITQGVLPHPGLPPPLLPIETPMAIQAAVNARCSPQHRVAAGSCTPPLAQQGLQQQHSQRQQQGEQLQQHSQRQQQQESDDEDFHSDAGGEEEASVAVQEPTEQIRVIECPMPSCSMTFAAGAIRLLEEHIHSHLEYVCPMCSLAFQRNNEAAYQKHVLEHFDDEAAEEPDPLANPAGPWGNEAFRRHHPLTFD